MTRLTLAAVAALVLAAAVRAGDAEKVLASLEGSWTLVAMQQADGTKVADGEELPAGQP